MSETLEMFGESLEAFQGETTVPLARVEVSDVEQKKRYKAINRNQLIMRSVDVERLVKDDDAVRAIWAMVCQLDWSRYEIKVKVQEGGKGRSSCDPRLLGALWIYAYSEGVNSARELSRMCGYEPGCQWLTGMEEVNYHTLADFRTSDKEALDQIFKQVLGLLSADGLVDLKRVMQDGTKIKAQASGNSFRREEKIREHLKLAEEQIVAMGDPHSEELSQQVIQARKRAVREKKQRLEDAIEELKNIFRTPSERAPRVSESDPEARVMKQSDGGFAPSYNVQICTEASNKIIVAMETVQAGNDYDQLTTGMDAIETTMGHTPDQMVTDGGYIKNANIEQAAQRGIDLIGPVAENNPEASLEKRGIDPEFYPDKFRYDEQTDTFTCPAEKMMALKRTDPREGRIEYHYRAQASDCAECPFRSKCCPKTSPRWIVRKQDSEPVKSFRAKVQTVEARQIYRTRAQVAEFPNAWIKEKLKLRKFRLRGLRKVSMEAVWAGLTYNIQQWARQIWKLTLAAA